MKRTILYRSLMSMLMLHAIIHAREDSASLSSVRRSTHSGRMRHAGRITRAHSGYGYIHEPCCLWRDDYRADSEGANIAEAQQLREQLWNDLDNGTLQDDWQWKDRRISEIETRLGHIVDWPR